MELYTIGKAKLPTWDEAKDQVLVCLCSKAAFDEMAAKCNDAIPHKPWQDLVAYVRLFLEETNDEGVASSIVRDSLLKMWGITQEELFEKAFQNETHCEAVPLTMVLGEQGDCENMAFVLERNAMSGYYMAGAAAGPSLIPACRSISGDGVYTIVPSSIHEVLLRKGADDADALAQVIQNINRSVLKEDDVLSDHPYFVNTVTGVISMVAKEVA